MGNYQLLSQFILHARVENCKLLSLYVRKFIIIETEMYLYVEHGTKGRIEH